MEKILILVIEEDKVYGEALCMYLNEHHREIKAHYGTLRDYGKLAAAGKQYDFLLMNQEIAERVQWNYKAAHSIHGGHLFFLTEKRENDLKDVDPHPSEIAHSFLFKYQAPEKMLSEIKKVQKTRTTADLGSGGGKHLFTEAKSPMRKVHNTAYDDLYQESGTLIQEVAVTDQYWKAEVPECSAGKGTELYGVFSCERECGVTTIAAGLAKTMARRGKKSLYLNFETYPTKLFCEFADTQRNAEEFAYKLIYGQNSDREDAWNEFTEKDEWGAEYLFFESGKNPLLSLTEVEFDRFMQALNEKGAYDYIFMDFFKIKTPVEKTGLVPMFFELCDGLIFVYTGSPSVRKEGELFRGEAEKRKLKNPHFITALNKNQDVKRCQKEELSIALQPDLVTMKDGARKISLSGSFGRDMRKIAGYLDTRKYLNTLN